MEPEGSYSQFTEALLGFFTSDDGAAAADSIGRYFDEHYTGSQFELLVDEDPNHITAKDIVAVSMLGVDIPAAVSVWLLSDEGQDEANLHLAEVPAGIDLWEEPSLLAPDGHLQALWDLLASGCWPTHKFNNYMGPTKISKLLAAKRPRLVPVTDSVVIKMLPSPGHWDDFASALGDPTVRSTIERATSKAPAHLSLLRRIDIVIWMLSH